METIRAFLEKCVVGSAYTGCEKKGRESSMKIRKNLVLYAKKV